MRMKKWTAALAVMGIVGLAACDSAGGRPQQPPAAQPEQPQAASRPLTPAPEGDAGWYPWDRSSQGRTASRAMVWMGPARPRPGSDRTTSG